MLPSRRDAWKGHRMSWGRPRCARPGGASRAAPVRHTRRRACRRLQASASQDACEDSSYSKKLRKECKKQAEGQQTDAIWSALAAGGAVGLFRFCGEGLYDRRRQDRGLGPKPGDVQW